MCKGRSDLTRPPCYSCSLALFVENTTNKKSLAHFVLYGHSCCFDNSQSALAYGLCHFGTIVNFASDEMLL